MAFEHVVIVGAGHSGGCAAGALRAAGFPGRITVVGAESHPPYERPPLSKELLSGSVATDKTYLQPLDWYTASNIELYLNTEVLGIDRTAQRLELSGGDTLPYDALLLTTGARARKAPFIDERQQRVFYVRDIDDALALREQLKPGTRLAVIGAGFIGLEIAASARKAGCTVTVVELAAQPLARVVPAEIGQHVAGLHRDQGVDLRLGCSVEAVEAAKGGATIRIAGGDTIDADIVAVGIGAVPNVELGAAAGLRNEDGIVVDELGRTSDPHIFAAGDVTRHFNPLLGRSIRLEAWQNAQNQAIAVAKVMAGGATAFSEVPWLWTDQYDMNMQVAGAAAEHDGLVYRGEPANGTFMAFQLQKDKVVGCISVNSARDMRFARMLIASGKPMDAGQLANPALKLQDMCR
jgi:NADPH-dependent 2,4-dienoyl-CoA reductase/sulfur reductase-like enzyme